MKDAIDKQDIEEFFSSYDDELSRLSRSEAYVVLGGAALVLLDIIDRSTTDIDVGLALGSLDSFSEAAEKFGITIQKVTQCTSVDFQNCEKNAIFRGQYLSIESISSKELIKSKLERFDKQDPQDIERLIQHIELSYSEFLELFDDLLNGFVGNFDRIKMHARTTVERHFPDKADTFRKTYKLSVE